MICGKCQTVNDANAKFCVNCGKQIDHLKRKPVEVEGDGDVQTDEVVVTEVEATADVAGAGASAGGHKPMPAREPDPVVEKAKEIGQSFLNYLLDGVKAPFQASKNVGAEQADLINGLITLLIFSLFIPFSVFVFGRWGRPPFFATVVVPFFLFIIFMAITVGIIFGVSRLMKSEIDFLAVFTRFMTFMIIPAGLAVLTFIVSIFNAYLFTGLLLLLIFLIVSLASVGTIFTIKETNEKSGGLDVTYVIIIHFLIISLVLALFGDALLGQLMNQMMNQLNPFFFF